MNVEELTARARAAWDTGDYAPTSRQLQPVSEVLVRTLGIGPEHTVLDVAAGHGNCALAAARRGATVMATDFAPSMIQAGRGRTEAAGLAVTWREADASDLPFEDGSFDVVTSVFGAIFAPDQQRTASEAARVIGPGCRVGFTAWMPDGYAARMTAILRRYGPSSDRDNPPDSLDWGRPERVEALFAPTGCSVEFHARVHTFRYPSWDVWRASFEAHGMAVVAKRAMPPDLYEAMFRDLRALTEGENHGQEGAVALDTDYLEIVATKP